MSSDRTPSLNQLFLIVQSVHRVVLLVQVHFTLTHTHTHLQQAAGGVLYVCVQVKTTILILPNQFCA